MRTSRGAMGGRRAYCERMDAALRDWDALLQALRDEAAGSTTRVRARYTRAAAAFEPRRDEAARALDALRSADDGDWQRMKPELERSMGDLRVVIERSGIT